METIITDNERQFLLNEMFETLDKYHYNYTKRALNKIIDTWAENKAPLIKAFKNSPNYVEGKFMIAFNKDYAREVNYFEVNNFMRWLFYNMPDESSKVHWNEDGTYIVPPERKCIESLMTTVGKTVQNITVEMIKEKFPDAHIHAGQKLTRAINKFCTYLGYDKFPDYNREFAKCADALNPLKVKRHTILSINPVDYLTMSIGNSWTSCHSIDAEDRSPGCYSSGTMSYMLDSSSMVFYVVHENYNGDDYFTQPKIVRQMFHYENEKLIQGRLYPQGNDGSTDLYTEYRVIVQEIIANIFDLPNYWTISRGPDNIGDYVETEGTHYEDYLYQSDCTISKLKGSCNGNKVTIGHNPICIECGYEHTDTETINCCTSPNCIQCEECGAYIDEEDGYWIGDSFYCEDCVTTCSSCGNITLVSEITNIGYNSVCNDCLEEYYTLCEDCDEYVPNDEATYLEKYDKYVCSDCLSDKYTPCDECGNYIKDEDITYCNGYHYCENCIEEIQEEEEEAI